MDLRSKVKYNVVYPINSQNSSKPCKPRATRNSISQSQKVLTKSKLNILNTLEVKLHLTEKTNRLDIGAYVLILPF